YSEKPACAIGGLFRIISFDDTDWLGTALMIAISLVSLSLDQLLVIHGNYSCLFGDYRVSPTGS
ncbi:hypothetical protein, partial [Shewanella sp.]|uniref:hypothetical protein n=1 Tax=Shewanella sp. TaxID=50422 RepID=UPI00257C6FBC